VLIIAIPAFVLMAILGIGALASTDGGDAGFVAVIVAAILTLLVFTVVSLIYAPLLMARDGSRNGQTWGKQALGIRVVRTDGQSMDFWWSALREVAIKNFGLSILSSFTIGIASLANYLWPLWDDRNRALHDIIVSTLVVHE